MVYRRILNMAPCAHSRNLLSTHSVCNSFHLPIPNSQSISAASLPPWQPQICSLCLWVCFCFVDKFIYVILLDSTYKHIIWYLVLSDLIHLIWSFRGPSFLLHMALFRFSLWPSDIPLCVCTTSLSMHLSVDICVVFAAWPLWMVLQWTLGCIYLSKLVLSEHQEWDCRIIWHQLHLFDKGNFTTLYYKQVLTCMYNVNSSQNCQMAKSYHQQSEASWWKCEEKINPYVLKSVVYAGLSQLWIPPS